MSTDKAVQTAVENGAAVLERVIVAGDLSRLQPADRVAYYRAVCESVGLNPLTQPFEYITLNGKLTLYAKKGATDQLRSIKGISIDGAERDTSDPDYATWIVTGRDASGRVDMEIGSVSIKGLAGENRANAIMKALTKGKRRLTLSLAGLGFLDETEGSSVPSAQAADVDLDTGEVRPRTVKEQIAARAAQVTTSAPSPVPTDGAPAAAPSPDPDDTGDGEGGAVIVVAEGRCEAFHETLGRCVRSPGHPEPDKGKLFHHDAEGRTWKDPA